MGSRSPFPLENQLGKQNLPERGQAFLAAAAQGAGPQGCRFLRILSRFLYEDCEAPVPPSAAIRGGLITATGAGVLLLAEG